jgi:thiamine pyrophosphokinase
LKALVVGGSSLPLEPVAHQLAAEADLVIAADSGYRKLQLAGIKPHWLVGDFDSLSAEELAVIPASVRINQHPADKDLLDITLAAQRAALEGATEIDVVGWADDRLDFTWAGLVELSQILGVERCWTLQSQIYIIRKGRSFTSPLVQGTKISFLPLQEATLYRTQGLRWNILDGGISVRNEVVGRFDLSISCGSLAVVLNSE